ncbi:MAG: hypothetical protein P8Y97_19190 [Candidatus Lokiarchaeota archaeon]
MVSENTTVRLHFEKEELSPAMSGAIFGGSSRLVGTSIKSFTSLKSLELIFYTEILIIVKTNKSYSLSN